MSDPTPPSDHQHRLRQGAHRGSRGLLAAVLPSVLAVAAVASLITALAVWQGDRLDQPGAAASESREQPQQERGAAAGAPRAAGTPAPSTTSPRAAGPAASSPAPEPSTEVEGTKAAVSDLEVVVLNQTSRSGLAAQVAGRLRSTGWDVPAVGNFRGVVPATTVYYPAGAEQDALAVAGDLPTEPRVRPRFGNLSTSRLTVVVTDSYPG